MTHLIACAACSRHVRALEVACPFCATPIPAGVRAEPPHPPPAVRLGRAALYAFGVGAVTATAAVAGCNHQEDTMVAVYGAPPVEVERARDAGLDAPATHTPAIQPPYGLPPRH